jgi:hypothetical protein
MKLTPGSQASRQQSPLLLKAIILFGGLCWAVVFGAAPPALNDRG